MMELIMLIIAAVIAAVVGAVTALVVERYRSKLQAISRYRESQSNLYIELWHPLYDLKSAANSLWEIADIFNLNKFVEQLQKTENTINRNILLIEENHVEELRRLIEAFWNFRIGKENLIRLRKERELYEGIDKGMIEEVIEHNRQTKEQYGRLIKQIERSFRRQLRTP